VIHADKSNYSLLGNVIKSVTKNPVLNAVSAVTYIAVISSFLHYAPQIFGKEEDTLLVPMVMLSLFVLSAAVMGYLFCYQPAQLYLDGHKQEATKLFLGTLGSFAVITGMLLGALFFVARV